MPDTGGSSHEFESWVDQVAADVKTLGLAEVFRRRVGEIDQWAKRGENILGAFAKQPEIRAATERAHATAATARAKPATAPKTIPGVVEADGTPVQCFGGAQFCNWGQTVCNVPAVTVVPKTKTGICNLVKWAASDCKTMRAAGYRPT